MPFDSGLYGELMILQMSLLLHQSIISLLIMLWDPSLTRCLGYPWQWKISINTSNIMALVWSTMNDIHITFFEVISCHEHLISIILRNVHSHIIHWTNWLYLRVGVDQSQDCLGGVSGRSYRSQLVCQCSWWSLAETLICMPSDESLSCLEGPSVVHAGFPGVLRLVQWYRNLSGPCLGGWIIHPCIWSNSVYPVIILGSALAIHAVYSS